MSNKTVACADDNAGWMRPSDAKTAAGWFGLEFIAVPDHTDTETLFSLLQPHYAAGGQDVPVEAVGWAGGAILRCDSQDAVWTLVYDEYVFTAFLFHEIGHILAERHFKGTWLQSPQELNDLAELAYSIGFTAEALSEEHVSAVIDNLAWYFGYQAALVCDRLASSGYASAVSYSLDILANYAHKSLRTLVKHISCADSCLRKNVLSMNDIGLYRGWKSGTGVDKIESTYFWRTAVTPRFGNLS